LSAQTCGGNYTVKSGDSLSFIADRLYKDASKWTLVFSTNTATISDANSVRIGQKLRIPCINGLPTGLEGGTVQTASVDNTASTPVDTVVDPRKISFVTSGMFPPFTGPDLPNRGLAVDIVQRAMEAANPEQGFGIYMVNDWDAHFDPLLSNALVDMSFPWFKPNCEAQPEHYRCVNLNFSNPFFEVLTLMFVNKANPISMEKPSDVHGKTICRPAGHATFFFDANGRNWVKDNHIKLERPNGYEQCLDMLVNGDVDGVAINEFAGRTMIVDLGLRDKVGTAVGEPLSIDAHHVVVDKSHPNGEALIEEFNKGLKELVDSGEFNQIIDKQMSAIWAKF